MFTRTLRFAEHYPFAIELRSSNYSRFASQFYVEEAGLQCPIDTSYYIVSRATRYSYFREKNLGAAAPRVALKVNKEKFIVSCS